MQNYIPQLIEDIKKAAKNLPVKPYYDIPPEAEGIEYVIEWENAEPKPMQEWFGIDKANFPPAGKLTKDELELLVQEIIKLWNAYNFDAVLPENLPADIAYTILVNYFDKPVAWVSEGIINIEFCDYEPENCPFTEEYCMCKDFVNDIDDDSDNIYFSGTNAVEIAILDKELKEIFKKKTFEYITEHKIEQYVNYLIEDLNSATEKIINKPGIPDNIDIRSAISIKEFVENPFLTIEELTGIPQKAFPDHIKMDGIQTRKVLKAMLELMDAYKLKIYYPKELPFEIKFEALSEGWDTTYVKHLPGSGDDVDFCTGDPMTCPYGEYCDCDDEEEDLELNDDLPPKGDDSELAF